MAGAGADTERIELENAAMGHPAVAEAAVIGIAHPKWQERPLLVVVKKKDKELTRAEMLGFIERKVARWWVPEDVVFVPYDVVVPYSKK